MQLSQIDIKEQKKAARSHFIELRKNISDEKREAAGLLICQNVFVLFFVYFLLFNTPLKNLLKD